MLVHVEPGAEFPLLKYLHVFATSRTDKIRINFPPMVVWIVGVSTHLETYDSALVLDVDLGARLLSLVDTRNVKTLRLALSPFDRTALEQRSPISFSHLEHLDVHIKDMDPSEKLWLPALVVKHCRNTLRKLTLPNVTFQDGPEVAFPSCPNLQELTLYSFVYSSNFIPQHFPSLQVLNVDTVKLVKLQQGWSSLSRFCGVKALKIRVLTGLREKYFGPNRDIPEAIQFFKKFPNLESLHIRPLMLNKHCGGFRASEDLRFSTLLASLKHVDLDCLYRIYSSDTIWGSGASLAVLTGVETLTMLKLNSAIATTAVRELPNLKMIQFPWGTPSGQDFCPDMTTLLEIATGVEKVVVTNCYPPSRVRSRRSKELLAQFLESAPNAECGC